MLTNLPIDDALNLLLGEKIKRRKTLVPLTEALGLILAEDIISDINIPPFNRSPLDGYAYRAEDTKDLPAELEVIDHIHAGYVSNKEVGEGQAIRLMTGSKIPEGANVVIRYEDTEFTDKSVKILKSLKPMDNIVLEGEDVARGDLILEKASKIGPAEMGVLASLGRAYVRVYERPRVAIIATGDELVGIDQELLDGKIRNSNSYSLYGQVLKAGGDPRLVGIVKDQREVISEALEEALTWADIIVTTGGVSVGDADVVKEAFVDAGADLKFWKVRIKPGSPIAYGNKDGKFLFGLSGNPAASFMTFEMFVRPVIMNFLGEKNLKPMELESILEDDFNKKSGQNRMVRAFTYKKDGKYYTRLTDKHSSGVLSSLVNKNSLFLVEGGTGPYKKGDKIKVSLMDNIEVEK